MSPKNRWELVRRWQGIVLVVAALVATVWLAATNQLILYIHPRYIVFTVIMAAFGLVLVVSSFVTRHDHDHEDAPPRRFGAVLSVAGIVITVALAVALIVVPPATLTTATADQRVVNSGQLSSSTTVTSAAAAPTGASAKFTVADWASLLRQSSDETFYRNKAANVIGFVSADPDDPDNVFYVSRFVITCCAVDAQPVGVPVYLPNWKNGFADGAWVQVKGSFDTNPSRSSKQPIALIPVSTEKTTQPSDPYLY